jgi:hypothetical protein
VSAQHTPGPWRLGSGYADNGGQYTSIVQADTLDEVLGEHGPSEEDARRIVQCVNAHDELVAVTAAVACFIGGAKDRVGRPDPAADDVMRNAREQVRVLAERYGVQGGHATYLDQCAALLRAAIAKATGSAS